MSLVATGSQTVGPFFHLGLAGLFQSDLAQPNASGERVSVRGRVIDGDGNGVPDAMLEVWQPDSGGFGRVPTGADGSFAFTTLKPGRVPGPEGKVQAPHVNVTVFMRGLLRQLRTRIYFCDDPAAVADDPILRLVDASRRDTLIAHQVGGAAHHLEWNVILQGQNETVFFDC